MYIELFDSQLRREHFHLCDPGLGFGVREGEGEICKSATGRVWLSLPVLGLLSMGRWGVGKRGKALRPQPMNRGRENPCQ